jgi:allantoate deiminase
MRHDALAAAAEIVLACEALARESGEPSRVSAGNARVSPGLYNVVPGACELWLEVRHVSDAALDALARGVHERCAQVAARRGVHVSVEERTRQEPTSLSMPLADAAESLARERGVAYRRMASGAAHDTMEFARAGIQALMLFVPSHGGISHAPDEFTPPEALWTGVEFARELIARLAVNP